MELDDQGRDSIFEHREILLNNVAFSALDVTDERALIEPEPVEEMCECDGGNCEAPTSLTMQTARQEVAAFVKVDRLALIRYGRVNNLEFRAIAISISSEHGQEIRVRFHDHVAIAPKQATVGQRCHHAQTAAELDHGK